MKLISAYNDFSTASTEVLNYLHARMGFNLWMVTRTESENWIVLNANDHGYNVEAGDVFRWTDSFCSRMVQDLGPRIAPKSADIPAYASAPIGQAVPIGAYVGVPLSRSDGELFGTLCAIDPSPMPDAVSDELPLVELLARLLTTILEKELKVHEEYRRAERARREAMTDGLTGMYNQRGWDQLLKRENIRCQRYGHPAGLISIDLDELKEVNDKQGHAKGNELLRRAAECLTTVARESDIVARVGGDEFAILAVECSSDGAEQLVSRLHDKFRRSNIAASIGMSMWHPAGSLNDAMNRADEQMYECKRLRKSDRANPFPLPT